LRFVYVLTLSFALLLLVPVENSAQPRQRRSSTPKRSTPTRGKRPATSNAAATALALQDGRQRVGEKIKQISNFVYLYGRFSKDFEQAVGPGGQPDATASALKNRLIGSLQDIREGLDGLELHFRTTASANRLDAAGRSLLEVINRLTDVLQEMN
jgi:hypothetical protein